jgi:stage II sporulation protein D
MTFRAALLLSIVLLPSRAADLRIGVFGLFQPSRLTIKPVPGKLINIHLGARAVFLGPAEAAGVLLQRGEIDVYAQRQPHTVRSVKVTDRSGGPADFLLSVPGRIERRFRGILVVTPGPAALLAVVTVDLESAVASAIAAESGAGAPYEALKAQAVVTRSYYLAEGNRHRNFDYCDTTHCQFFRAEPEAGSDFLRSAAETAGLVLKYRNLIVPVRYSASCGGRTRSLTEAHQPAPNYPFYPVECPTCRREAKTWISRLHIDEAWELLIRPGSERARIQIVRRLGAGAVPGSNYTARREGDRVILDGKGRGHGIGLCQQGAAGMAAEGAPFSAILQHYLPNTIVAPAR